jgi:hypothetical protein
MLSLKYSAKAELVDTVSTGIAESKKQASCPWPGRWRSTESTLSTPTVCNILARSEGWRRREGEGGREEGGEGVREGDREGGIEEARLR